MVYPIGKIIVPPIYKLWLRKVEGLENVPKNKTFIIATNHSSYYDAVLMHSIIVPYLDKKIHALVNSYYWKNFITRVFIEWGEGIPVFVEKEKNAKKRNQESFEKALSYLQKNDLIMIFPEGRRSADGKLRKAYTGIARLALKAKVPVLPVGIIGANKVLPVGKTFPRFARCEVNIGQLMYFENYYSKKINDKVLEEATRKIMKEIATLIGQKYTF